MGFIERIWERMQKKKYDKLKANRGNPPVENKFTISNQNPQSWAPDLHPKGREHSSYIDSIDYDGATKKMQVTFTNGFSAEYDNISKKDAEGFNKADSKGRYFNWKFRSKPYREI